MTEMTMRQAIEMAQQYGHVPLRISGPPIDMQGGGPSNPLDTVTGVWGVPDGRGGVIPLERLPATTPPDQAWRGQPFQGSPAQGPPQQIPRPSMNGAPPASYQQPPPSTSGAMVTPSMSAPKPAPPTFGPPTFGPQQGPSWPPVPTADVQRGPYQAPGGQPVVNVNISPGNSPSWFNPNATAQSYGGVAALPNMVQQAQPATDAYRGVMSQLTGIGQPPSAGIMDNMVQQAQPATDAYRRWLGDVTGVNQLPGMFQGVMGREPQRRNPLGAYDPNFPMGKTYGNPSAMHNPDYPFSPSWQGAPYREYIPPPQQPPIMGNLSR